MSNLEESPLNRREGETGPEWVARRRATTAEEIIADRDRFWRNQDRLSAADPAPDSSWVHTERVGAKYQPRHRRQP